MNTIIIYEPIWKDRSVGVAEDKMTTVFRIIIPYKKKCGDYLYPNAFYLGRDQAKRYPKKVVKGVTLRILPIKNLTIGEKLTIDQMEEARNGRFQPPE